MGSPLPKSYNAVCSPTCESAQSSVVPPPQAYLSPSASPIEACGCANEDERIRLLKKRLLIKRKLTKRYKLSQAIIECEPTQSEIMAQSDDQAQNEAQNGGETISDLSTQNEKSPSHHGREADLNCNSCFLCFRSWGRDYAVQVDFAWPSRTDTVKAKSRIRRKSRNMRDSLEVEGDSTKHRTANTRRPRIGPEAREHEESSIRPTTTGIPSENSKERRGDDLLHLQSPEIQASVQVPVETEADESQKCAKSGSEQQQGLAESRSSSLHPDLGRVKEYMVLKEVTQGTQVQVFQALQSALYRQQGRWKKYLWCYDIVEAREISFHFDDVVDKQGRTPICVTPLLPVTIRDQALSTLNDEPTYLDYDMGSACIGPHHTEACCHGMEFGVPCIQDRLQEAERRIRGFRMQHWLKECVQKPSRAETKQVLDNGLLQKSFVYMAGESVASPTDADQLLSCGEFRGIYVSLGWNVPLLVNRIRAGSVWTIFVLTLIWLGIVVWAGQQDDWSTALAFGQVLAASAALVLHHT